MDVYGFPPVGPIQLPTTDEIDVARDMVIVNSAVAAGAPRLVAVEKVGVPRRFHAASRMALFNLVR